MIRKLAHRKSLILSLEALPQFEVPFLQHREVLSLFLCYDDNLKRSVSPAENYENQDYHYCIRSIYFRDNLPSLKAELRSSETNNSNHQHRQRSRKAKSSPKNTNNLSRSSSAQTRRINRR